MPGQRQYRRQVVAAAGKTAGHMHHRLQQANLLHHLMLATQLVEKIIETWLACPDQPRQIDGGPHIGQRIVRLAMLDAVGLGQPLQLERHPPLLVLRPLDAVRAQRIGGADQIDQIPAAVATLPLAGIGIVEVAVETITCHLVIETQAVVAGAAGAGLRQLSMYSRHELGLGQPLFRQNLRRDAGNPAGCRMRQDIVGGLAIEVERLADFVELLVGAQTGDLQRTIAARVDAGGFVVVPEDAGAHGRSFNVRGPV